jgi:hypothetical protein
VLRGVDDGAQVAEIRHLGVLVNRLVGGLQSLGGVAFLEVGDYELALKGESSASCPSATEMVKSASS